MAKKATKSANDPGRFNTIGMQTFKVTSDSALDSISSNRIEDNDPFVNLYGTCNLIEPPYRFTSLYQIYEESDILKACIAAMQKNVDGFGYRLDFLGDDLSEKDSPEAQIQFENISQFFNEPNKEHPFRTIRTEMRKDFEVLGQSALEVVRFKSGGMSAVYYLPMVDLRMSVLDSEAITIQTTLWREGRLKKVNVRKRFRRYAQVLNSGWTTSGGGGTIRWFKQLGDPRILDATTGEYVSSRKEAKEVATEVLLLQQPTNGRTYATPRWIANVTDIKGRSNAQYINYDIGESQGIPPMMLLVQNGMLSDESKEQLRSWAESMRGPENFSRIALLEAVPEIHGIDDKGNVQIKLENLTDSRSQDLMFSGYLDKTAEAVRQAFRLPGLYLGNMGDMSYAGSYTIAKTTEEQVFIPERQAFDDVINTSIIRGELKSTLWKYVTLGPQIVSSEELRLSLKEFASSGAISINTAIDILNNMFGLNVSKYNEVWASMPSAILKIMASNQSFAVPELVNYAPPTKTSPKASEGDAGAPSTSSEPMTPPMRSPSQKAS
jgi:PBSX family phage portal protein